MNTMTIARVEVEKLVRILLLAAVLAVGALQVSRCGNDNDYGDHASVADRAERSLR